MSGGNTNASQIEQRDRERTEIEALLRDLDLAWEWLDDTQSIEPYWLHLEHNEYPADVRSLVIDARAHNVQLLVTGHSRWYQRKFLEKQWQRPHIEELRELLARTAPALLELTAAVGIVDQEPTWRQAREAASALWERWGYHTSESGEQGRQREVGLLKGARRVERELQVLRALSEELDDLQTSDSLQAIKRVPKPPGRHPDREDPAWSALLDAIREAYNHDTPDGHRPTYIQAAALVADQELHELPEPVADRVRRVLELDETNHVAANRAVRDWLNPKPRRKRRTAEA